MAAAAAVDRRPEGPPSSWPYPFAAAADTVRAQQKDAYFTAQVTDALAELYRCLAGARAAHARAAELRALAALFYLGLTTLPGNRTLGEEYCDLVQVRAPTARLPSLRVRTAYVVVAAAGPFLLARFLPRSTAWLRSLIDRRRDALRARRQPIASPASPVPSSPHIGGGACSPSAPSCYEARLLDYLARNLPALKSTAPLQALSLVLFYLHGSYYELPKRLLSLRYLFTRSVPDTPDRAGYEVLGFLLVIQLAVQAYLHLRANLVPSPSPSSTSTSTTSTSSSSPSHDLLIPDLAAHALQVNRVDIASTTHTPPAHRPRIDLANPVVMPYICGPQQRKCTLCLEELKDPSATSCGHIFCWLCIADWVREKPECPLCRREAMVHHILPLRIL